VRWFWCCLLAGCGADPILDASIPDAGSPTSDASDAGLGVDAEPSDAATTDAGEADGGSLWSLCLGEDPDLLRPLPVAAETATCAPGFLVDASEAVFPDLGQLPSDYSDLHRLCAMMDPAPSTYDHIASSTLAAAIDDYLRMMLDRPALQRAMVSVSSSTAARLEALRHVWLAANGFEHVLCGELNPNGSVGGLHMWSEFYLAEREARANYLCTVEGLDDPDVMSIRYEWTPPGRTTPSLKPIGSFHVGMSPACLLALGYYAIDARIEAQPGARPSFVATIHGQPVSFALGVSDGAILSVFPLADPR
jgi:hypothetical protein